jgi:two-component system sensor histidine kinase/response regulator
MPVMDGVTATVQIRKIERLARLPIVAMTANAMDQDRRKCMDCGMNDFLVKPIDPEALRSILLRWIRPRQAAAAMPPAIAPPCPRTAVPNDLPRGIAGLDVALGLSRMMGKKPLYIAMLRKYAAGQKNAPQAIRRALDSDDWTTAERLAHTVKGVSGSIGASHIPGCADKLEHAIKERKTREEIDPLLRALEIPLGELITALETQLPAESAEPAARPTALSL